MSPFRSGSVAILGPPNVGKSTLFNALIGENLAAVTPKPQTTRHRILGVKQRPDGQILFLDSPGLHRPHRALNEIMVETARAAASEADLTLLVLDSRLHEREGPMVDWIHVLKRPLLVALNKVDLARGNQVELRMVQVQESFHPDWIQATSAVTKEGLDRLEQAIWERLPEGPPLYPEDTLTDRTERFIASEVIREKVFELTEEEVPYSVVVVVEDYRDPRPEDQKKVVRIRASVIVERDSQKGILIGQGGKMIKKIGEMARRDLESRLGEQVFLDLFVRVEPEWTKDPQKVREFVYPS